jgi:hypothetical protein
MGLIFLPCSLLGSISPVSSASDMPRIHLHQTKGLVHCVHVIYGSPANKQSKNSGTDYLIKQNSKKFLNLQDLIMQKIFVFKFINFLSPEQNRMVLLLYLRCG